MKNLLVGLLLLSALFLACRNGDTQQATTAESGSINIEKVEKESKELEQTANEIDKKGEALEAALKELE